VLKGRLAYGREHVLLAAPPVQARDRSGRGSVDYLLSRQIERVEKYKEATKEF